MLARLFTGVILLAATYTCTQEGFKRSAKEQAAWDKLSAPPLSSLSPKIINLVTLGHKGLYDDFISIWSVQVLADPKIKEFATKDTLMQNLRHTLSHTPKLESLYILSCFTLALDFDAPEFCEEISLAGLKAFPNSWRIPMIQGFVFSFKLGDNAKAAAYFGIASTRPQSPAWVASHAIKLANSEEANTDTLNETIYQLQNVSGGTKLIELLKPRFKNLTPAPVKPQKSNAPAIDIPTQESPHP
jgi:hypothetical protein